MELFTVPVRLADDFDSMDQTFIFTDEVEAQQFSDHMRDLYGQREARVGIATIDTYDSAIQAVVEAIGPSPDEGDPDLREFDRGVQMAQRGIGPVTVTIHPKEA